MTGVEVPPDRPGLAVIKRVSVTEAEPGDTVTYVIIYRNMGNTPDQERHRSPTACCRGSNTRRERHAARKGPASARQ